MNGLLARFGRVVLDAGRRPAFLLAAPSVALFMVFFLAPLAWMLRLSTYEAGGKGQSRFYELGTFTLSHFAEIFRDPFFLKLGWITLQLGLMITVITMALAIPFSIYVHRSRGAWKRALILAVILPKLTNLLVLMYGVLLLLGDTGYINKVLLALRVVEQPLPRWSRSIPRWRRRRARSAGARSARTTRRSSSSSCRRWSRARSSPSSGDWARSSPRPSSARPTITPSRSRSTRRPSTSSTGPWGPRSPQRTSPSSRWSSPPHWGSRRS
jgi:hypothetical protein